MGEGSGRRLSNLSMSNPFTSGESRSDGRRYRLAVYPTKTHEISSAHLFFFSVVKILN